MEFEFLNRQKSNRTSKSALAGLKSNFQYSYRNNPVDTDGPNVVSGSTSRRSVAKQGNNEFVSPTRKRALRSKSATPAPSYSSTTKRKKRTKKVTKTNSPLSKKVYWSILSLLFLRIIFMDNGVIDYFNMEKTLEYKQQEYLSITKENNDLIEEVKLIKSNRVYQKKLAREHLGVIAPDEYLVLFARENTSAR